jgi:hypothetical protein
VRVDAVGGHGEQAVGTAEQGRELVEGGCGVATVPDDLHMCSQPVEARPRQRRPGDDNDRPVLVHDPVVLPLVATCPILVVGR